MLVTVHYQVLLMFFNRICGMGDTVLGALLESLVEA